MNEEMQQAYYLSQIQKKRALKEQCLRAPQSRTEPPEEESALTGTVMANLMAFSIKERRNVLAMMEELRRAPKGKSLLDSALSWIERLADGLDVGAYELLIDDVPRRRKIVYGLINHLERDGCDGWEDIQMDDAGNAWFVLPEFDAYWGMGADSGHGITLVFQREQLENGRRFRLMMGSTAQSRPDALMPDHAILWEESTGELADFVEKTLSDLQGGWLLQKERFQSRRNQLEQELQKLQGLYAVLEEQPQGLKPGSVLAKEAGLLEQLREETQKDYSRMSPALKESHRGKTIRDELLLLGGAAQSLRRAAAEPEGVLDALTEAVFLLEGVLQTDKP